MLFKNAVLKNNTEQKKNLKLMFSAFVHLTQKSVEFFSTT